MRWVLSPRGIGCFAGTVAALTPLLCAASPPVVINEVLYDAVGTDTGHEWLEIFNPSGIPVDLSGWRIERGWRTTFVSVFTFPSGATIAPEGFLTVGEAHVPDVDFTGTLAFENGGSATDGIRLVDSAGTVVDVLLYDEPNTNNLPDESGAAGTSFAPDVAEGHSLARVPDGTDTNHSAVDFVDSAVPTPGSTNVLPTPPPSPTPTPTPTPRPPPTGVVVNEALPNPVGSDSAGEFIELFNTSGAPVDLGGAQLDDAEGGSTPYLVPDGTTIAGGAYLSFPRSETGLALNNDGDRARLLAADGSVVSELAFGSSPAEGVAWARKSEGAADWTATPTPDSANVFTPLAISEDEDASPTPTPTPQSRATTAPSPAPRVVSLAEARALPLRTRVQVSGAVSAPPGILGRGVFYIAGSGMQVFVSSGEPPDLVVGDHVTVTGVVSAIRNEARLRVAAADVRKLGAAPPPEPVPAFTGSIGEILEGILVRVRGEITQLSGNTFELDDGSGAARILVKKTAGWARPRLARGQRVAVTGIVSQSGERYRVLPRFAGDIVLEGIVESAAVRRAFSGEGASATALTTRRVRTRAPEPEDTEPERANDEDTMLRPETAEAAPRAVPNSAPVERLPLPTILAWSGAGALGLFRLLARRG